MNQPTLSRLSIKLIALCVLITCLILFTNKATYSRFAPPPPQILAVQIEPQPQSLLQISSTKILSSDPFSPNVAFTVTNNGQKGIRAYTVVCELVTDGGSRKTALFTHMTTQEGVLKSGQSKSESINEQYSPVFVKSIVLSIDFVELEDGETWGKDSYNSAERLAGQRAGGRDAVEHFHKVREEKGDSALLEAVTSDTDEIIPPEGHSPEWLDGYRSAVALVQLRLKKAKQGNGLKGVEEELQKPADAAEGRPE
jgi:hypothetical protein